MDDETQEMIEAAARVLFAQEEGAPEDYPNEWEAALLHAFKEVLDTALAAKDEELAAVKAREAKLRACLGFFASVIKSGEPWTATCEQRYRAALPEQQP